jgi:hypothetical protein
MVGLLRHRQTKGAETDMFDLKKPRHISTLPYLTVATRQRGRSVYLRQQKDSTSSGNPAGRPLIASVLAACRSRTSRATCGRNSAGRTHARPASGRITQMSTEQEAVTLWRPVGPQVLELTRLHLLRVLGQHLSGVKCPRGSRLVGAKHRHGDASLRPHQRKACTAAGAETTSSACLSTA